MKIKILYHSIPAFALSLAAIIGSAGCNSATIKAETTPAKDVAPTVAEAKFNDGDAPTALNAEKAASQITPASVAGNYEYATHKNGEGYDNSLEIKAAGGDKLYVYLSGSYIYKIGETQSFHEAEGKGDAVLRGNIARATLVDEAGKPCRATITFKKAEAAVTIPNTCQFNIALGGIYKRTSGEKSNEPARENLPETAEITFRELADFANDFDSHRPGERFVVTDVPPDGIDKITRADEFGNKSYKNIFRLDIEAEDGYNGNGFLTSQAMLESLTREVKRGYNSLRLTAVLIESNGKFDVYRMSFVTQIEGIDEDGALLWTATGDAPPKTKFVH